MVEVVFAPDGTATYNRYAFYQWDAGQKLKIIGLSLEPTVEIHFANKGLPAVVMLGETETGVTIVDVPDIVLQRYGDLNVYIYRNDGTLNYTSHALLFTVRKRERPVDYVEQVQPGIIAQLVNKLNRIIETGIASYEPDVNTVNQMIKDYVTGNIIVNNQATTEKGYALDARQANPSIPGTLGAKVNELNNKLVAQTIDLSTILTVENPKHTIQYARATKYGNLITLTIHVATDDKFTSTEAASFVLPAEYRPPMPIRIPCMLHNNPIGNPAFGYTDIGYCVIAPDGNFMIRNFNGSTATFALVSVTYIAT